MTKFQVKPACWLTDGGLCRKVGMFFSAPMRHYVFVVIGCRKKCDGSATRERRCRCKRGPKRNQRFPLFPSFSRTDAKGGRGNRNKRNRWEQISGVSPSRCFLAHLQVEISATGGRGQKTNKNKTNLKQKQKKCPPLVRRGRSSVWVQIVKGKGDDTDVRVCKNTRPSTAGT